jgi:hypothetical protein
VLLSLIEKSLLIAKYIMFHNLINFKAIEAFKESFQSFHELFKDQSNFFELFLYINFFFRTEVFFAIAFCGVQTIELLICCLFFKCFKTVYISCTIFAMKMTNDIFQFVSENSKYKPTKPNSKYE